MGFRVKDAEGNILYEVEDGKKVLAVSLRSTQGEGGRVVTQNLDEVFLVFEHPSTLVPNLLEVEERAREARRAYGEERNPQATSDDLTPDEDLSEERQEQVRQNTERIEKMNADENEPNTVADSSDRPVGNRATKPNADSANPLNHDEDQGVSETETPNDSGSTDRGPLSFS